jgi:hypothetical protein
MRRAHTIDVNGLTLRRISDSGGRSAPTYRSATLRVTRHVATAIVIAGVREIRSRTARTAHRHLMLVVTRVSRSANQIQLRQRYANHRQGERSNE